MQRSDPVTQGSTSGAPTSDLVRAARGEPVSRTPVWFMRQAGRSLPEYRAIRAGIGMLAACQTPELVTEITLQPVRRHGVDAAVLYSDIVVPLALAGVDVDIVPGTGPVIADPVRTAVQVDALPPLSHEQLSSIEEAVRMTVAELGVTPLVGFAGAPFTVSSYLIEGGPSRTFQRTKALMYGDPPTWDRLMRRVAHYSTGFLLAQVAAGASVVQLFDSWVGALPLADYRRYVQPHSASVLRALADTGVPRIHFGVGTGELLAAMGEAGADVVGVDYRVDLADGIARVGPRRAVQGNLDPAMLMAPWEVVAQRTTEIVQAGAQAKGHIFNLGHGVLPDTDPGVLTRLVEHVHEVSTR